MPRSTPRKPAAAPSSAPGWQTAATVLLILHLFFLGMGLVANSGGGKSLLAPALRQIPLVRPYLQLLWMDIAYDVGLASPLPEDGVHSLALDIDGPAAEGDIEPAVLPPPGLQPRIRRQRYQQLAFHVAYFDELFAENSDLRTELPLAIAEEWLRELDAPHRSYLLRCRREPAKRLPKAVERAPSKPREGGPRLAGPALYETQTVTIHLIWNPDDGKYQASREEAEGLRSHVVKPVDESAAPADQLEDDVGVAPADDSVPAVEEAPADQPAAEEAEP